MSEPLVSILIPAFNSQKWIADTLRSAIAQTWDRKEIIVVDDGSADNTLGIARQFESKTLRVFQQKNQGGPAARNTALSLSQGDYIQWLDHDDLMDSTKISRQMAARHRCQSNRTLLSCAWGHFIYRQNAARFVPTSLWTDLSPTEFLLRKMSENIFMQTSNWLVSRELSEAAGPWDTSMLTDDDGEYFCRVLMASDGTRFVPGAKVYWRSSGTAQASYMGRSQKKLEAQWSSILLHMNYLRSLEDSPRTRAACVKYLQNWMIYFYPERMDITARAQEIAKELGGQLETPRLSWKYDWFRMLFGWSTAKHIRLLLPSTRWSLIRWWDHVLFRLERPKTA